MNNLTEILNSGGEKFVDFAVPMLIQSSVLIVILLAVDLLLRKKVRATFRYWLWMLVLVKLVLPPTLTSPVSFGGIFGDKITPARFESVAVFEPTTPEAPTETSMPTAIDTVGAEILATKRSQAFVGTAISETDIASKAEAGALSWQAIVLVVWAGAAGAMVLLVVQRLFFVLGLIRQAQPAQGLLTETLRFCRKRMAVNLPIRLKVSANATSPAVCGLFRPVILVPQDIGPSLGPGHLRPVLMHELGHIKRGDLWVNLIQTVLQIIYFYNPLLWLANSMIRRVREQAVDEMVQVAMGNKAQDYPETLLNVAKLAFGRPALALRFIGVVESKSQLQGRIKKMLNQPIPKTAKLGFAGLAAIIISAVVLLPMAAGGKTEPGKTSFTATLSNGATVEFIGVCDYPEPRPRCWRPDGSIQDREIFVKRERDYSDGKYGFILKIAGPEDLSFAWNKIEGSKGYWGSCTVVDGQGRVLDGFEAAVTKNADGRNTTNIRVGIATGPWKTIAEHTGRSMGISNGITFTEAVETEKGVQIYTSDALGKDVTQRIVAIDNSGNLHPWQGHTGSVSNSQIRQSIGTFPDLKLDQIKEFQFQTRPCQWVEFKNVSLKLGYKTDVQIEFEKSSEADETSSQAHENVIDDYFTRVYSVNKSVADFAEREDLSSPESAYAAINRVSASGDESAWAKVSVQRLAEKFSGGGKSAVDPEWASVLLNARILEVRIFDGRLAMVTAELPQAFSSKPIIKPIDVRNLEMEEGRWLNTGNDRVNTLEEAEAIFKRRMNSAGERKISQNPVGKWQTVDFVEHIEDFEPGERQSRGDLYLKDLDFNRDGTTSGPWTWETGSLYHPGDRTTAKYVIKEIDGNRYLFMEWMSGDLTIRGREPAYYVLEKTGPSTRTSASKGESMELVHDDGKDAGKWSFSGGGHGVKFTAPSDGCVLKAVKLYGARYGEFEAPDEDFDVWVCDKNFNVIANFKFPYSLFAKRGYIDWVTLDVDDVKVPKDFAICAAFDPHQTKGIYVYHDAKGSGRSYRGIPPEMEPFKDGDWMIRAVVETPDGRSSRDARPSRAERIEAENLAGQAWKLWAERKLPEAEDLFRQAVEKDPTNANAWNGLGWAQQNQGKVENARNSFERCLEIEPRQAAALNGLGWIAKSEGNTDDAIEYWEKSVIVSGGNATAALNGLTQTYMELGQYDQAVKYYQKWLKVEPNNEQVKEGLARAQAMQQ